MAATTSDAPTGLDAIDDASLAEARDAVRGLAAELDLDRQLEPYGRHVWDGRRDGPNLHLDDFSEIPFLIDIVGCEEYQHRARTRAGDGDLFAAVTPVAEGYEEYCRERLRLGSPELVAAVPVEGPLAVAEACSEGEARERLALRAREAGGLTIEPYMGIEPVWKLAELVAGDSGAPVTVVAPPPPVTWIANDKASFGEVVSRVVGDGYLVASEVSDHVARLAVLLHEMAGRHPMVALKRLRCASGMGNAIFESRTLLQEGRAAVAAEVRDFLERTEWHGHEEVLVEAWEDAAVSPSTQLWIPPLACGPPRLDGIYEQILEGPEKVFVGSRPSQLGASLDRRIADAALRVAAGLQALGYVGRCSFDFLVLGDPQGDCELRLTECNGRWGGTSTPMSLLDRVWPGPRPPYRAQDFIHPQLLGVPFPEILARVGDELYDPATGRGRFIFYNVGPLAHHGKLDVIAVGNGQAAAEAALEEDLPRLLGL